VDVNLLRRAVPVFCSSLVFFAVSSFLTISHPVDEIGKVIAAQTSLDINVHNPLPGKAVRNETITGKDSRKQPGRIPETSIFYTSHKFYYIFYNEMSLRDVQIYENMKVYTIIMSLRENYLDIFLPQDAKWHLSHKEFL
jgi:hypothetical protein